MPTNHSPGGSLDLGWVGWIGMTRSTCILQESDHPWTGWTSEFVCKWYPQRWWMECFFQHFQLSLKWIFLRSVFGSHLFVERPSAPVSSSSTALEWGGFWGVVTWVTVGKDWSTTTFFFFHGGKYQIFLVKHEKGGHPLQDYMYYLRLFYRDIKPSKLFLHVEATHFNSAGPVEVLCYAVLSVFPVCAGCAWLPFFDSTSNVRVGRL